MARIISTVAQNGKPMNTFEKTKLCRITAIKLSRMAAPILRETRNKIEPEICDFFPNRNSKY